MLPKYEYTEKEQKEILDSLTVICDTREKSADHITQYFEKKKIPYTIKKLHYGDYSFMIPQNEKLGILKPVSFANQIVIERKSSLEELSGNLTKERERFEKELSLCKAQMILLIENANYSDVLTGNYNTEYNKKSFLGSLHSFQFKYSLPFFFMPDNKCSPIFIYATFQYWLRNYIR